MFPTGGEELLIKIIFQGSVVELDTQVYVFR